MSRTIAIYLLGVPRKVPDIFRRIFIKFRLYGGIIIKVSHIKPAMLVREDRRSDGRKDMSKVLGIFREYAKASNNNDTYQYRHIFMNHTRLRKSHNTCQYFSVTANTQFWNNFI